MNTLKLPERSVGDFSITALSDGDLWASPSLLQRSGPTSAPETHRQDPAAPACAIHINSYLVRSHKHTILIDAGAGGFRQWGGLLPQQLAIAGVSPAEVDMILLTHAHPDHIGGLLDSAGAAAFANAELFIHQHELSFWDDDAHLSRASDRARGNFLFARTVLEQYRRRLRPFSSNDIIAGISAIPLPGHTVGHCGYRLDSEADSLLIWGDIVHFPERQIADPGLSIAFDHDPSLSALTRTKLLDLVCTDHLPVAGMHLGKLGFARIQRLAGRYAICYET